VFTAHDKIVPTSAVGGRDGGPRHSDRSKPRARLWATVAVALGWGCPAQTRESPTNVVIGMAALRGSGPGRDVHDPLNAEPAVDRQRTPGVEVLLRAVSAVPRHARGGPQSGRTVVGDLLIAAAAAVLRDDRRGRRHARGLQVDRHGARVPRSDGGGPQQRRTRWLGDL